MPKKKNNNRKSTMIIPADIETGIMGMDEEAMEVLGPEGVGIDLLPRVELLHAGTVAFGIKSVEEEEQDIIKGSDGFDAVILHMHQVRAYWEDAFDDRDVSDPFPDCSSLDARVGVNRETSNEMICAECEFAQWGSAEVGQGQACSLRMRVFLLMEGSSLPYFMLVPVTSIKAMQFYWVGLGNKGYNYHNVFTHFGAEMATRPEGNIKYSKLTLSKVGDIPPEDAERLRPLIDMCKLGSKQTPVSAAQEDAGKEMKEEDEAEDKEEPFGDQ